MLIAIVVMFVLFAIADLVVGVSNDAVNFLHSAIGSAVARKRVIYGVAAAGILVGVFFSQNMMDLTSSGIVSPGMFTFHDLMSVFVAVMIVNIVLIDVCNSYGIPTSTTTALIIGLIGGSLAIALIKSNEGTVAFKSFVDTNHIFLILGGIFISVNLAFVIGLITQFLARVMFTFQSNKRSAVLLSFVGAIALTVIVFFIIKKVLHAESLLSESWATYMQLHIQEILWLIFAIIFSILLVSGSLFNINIPRIVVIFGTFALAMAFAANDLVNFIGVPLTGIESAIRWHDLGIDAKTMTLGFLENPADNPTLWWHWVFFCMAGMVLAVTIFRSIKTQAVIDTQLLLERQSPGEERFGSSEISRRVVRIFLQFYNHLRPSPQSKITTFLRRRYQPSTPLSVNTVSSGTYFDTIRASVNLVVSSILILSGTWLQIPLSTTFIVFMVAMGSSLADQAWNRENAVYRVSGMFTILGVWLLVSLLTFLSTGILTFIIWHGGGVAIMALIILAVWVVTKSWKYFKARETREKLMKTDIRRETEINLEWMADTGSEIFRKQLLETSKIYFLTLQGFIDEDLAKLREGNEKAELLIKQSKTGRQTLYANISKMSDYMLEPSHHYIQAYDYMSELVQSMHNLTTPIREHIENNHKGLNESQKEEISHLLEETTTYFNYLIHLEKEFRFSNLDDLMHRQQMILPMIDELRKNQLKRLKSGDSKTRVSILYLEILAETKNILLYSINMIKSHRDFFVASRLR